MDVRKLAVVLCALILGVTGIALVFRWEAPEPIRSRRELAVVAELESRHGPALRALGVKSLGVDRRTRDVVVVFARSQAGRKGVGRLSGLAGSDGCGEVDVGLDVSEPLTAWGDTGEAGFLGRVDCIVDEVLARVPEMRD